jgi:translation initiation factor IF-2
VFPVRRKRTPSSPLRPAPVPTLSNEQCAPEVHRAGRRSGPTEHRPGTREAGPRGIAEPAGERGPGREALPGTREAGPRGIAEPAARAAPTARPARTPPSVPRRPAESWHLRRVAAHPMASLPWAAPGNPAASLPGAAEAPRGQRGGRRAPGQKGPSPEFPPAVRRGTESVWARVNPGVTEAKAGPAGRRPKRAGRSGEPPGANRPRLVRGGNGGAGEQEPRAPGRCAQRGSSGRKPMTRIRRGRPGADGGARCG